MPYKKTFLKTYRKRNTRSQRGGSLASKAYKLAKKATNTLELHKHGETMKAIRSAYDVIAQPLSAMIEGDTSETRTGLKIWARSIRFHYECVWNSTATGVDEPVRIVIVQDKMGNGAVPTGADMLESANSYASISQRNRKTEGKRFKFLYDKTHRNPRQVTNDTHTLGRKLIIPLKFPIWYLGNTAASTDLGRSNLYLLAFADQTAASANGPNVRYTYRLYFDP